MSSKVKAVVLGIDDVLYDTSLQTDTARLSAVKAMIEAGLPIDVETGYRTLTEIVKELGPDNTRHFDKLLERLGLKWNPSAVAAGVVAYRETSPIYLKPYPDTIPTILKLRDLGYKLGVASAGKSVKQWQKLTSLGLQHSFHAVVISEDLGEEGFTKAVLNRAIELLKVRPSETMLAGAAPGEEINAANQVGVISVRLRKGSSKLEKTTESKPKYEINKLSEILQLLQGL
jgi:putative hydrolase of the HAD superfamily